MKKLTVFLLSALALVSCVKDGDEQKSENQDYKMVTCPAQKISENSATLCCTFAVPEGVRLHKDCHPYILMSNTDLEKLFKYGIIEGAGIDETWADAPASILDLKLGDDYVFDDKIQIVVAKEQVKDTLKVTVKGLKPDTKYFYSSVMIIDGENPKGVFGAKKTFTTSAAKEPEPGGVTKADLIGVWECPFSKSMEPFGFPNLTYDGGTTLAFYDNDGFILKDHGGVTCSDEAEAKKVSDALLAKGYTSTNNGKVVAFKWGGKSLEGTFQFVRETQTLTLSPYNPSESKEVYTVRIEKDGSLVLTDAGGTDKSYKK